MGLAHHERMKDRSSSSSDHTLAPSSLLSPVTFWYR